MARELQQRGQPTLRPAWAGCTPPQEPGQGAPPVEQGPAEAGAGAQPPVPPQLALAQVEEAVERAA